MFEGKLAFADHSSSDRNQQEKNTRDGVWLSPDERETLKHTGRLARKHFFFFFLILHPQNIWLCRRCQRLWGQGVKTRRVRRHVPLYSGKRSREKTGWGVEKRRKKKPIRQVTAPRTSSRSLTLLPRSVRAPTYTQANTQIQDVGSQFSKHSPYPLPL